MANKRLLITGISGLLGNNIAYCLKKKYDILGLYNTHIVRIPDVHVMKVDLRSFSEVQSVIAEFRPDVIIHCAAISDVDHCEEEPQLAYDVNVKATKNIVDAIEHQEIKLIYISTDLVYAEGDKSLLGEESPLNPPNNYGRTKLQGEQEALKRKNALVVRTNFFGWNITEKFSLAEWIIHELSSKKEIGGFTDVYFSSIYSFDLARLLDRAFEKDLRGIYNFGSKSSISKYDFAIKIAQRFGLDKSLIKPISVDQFPLKAKRNKNISMDVSKINKDLDVDIPGVDDSIQNLFEDFRKGIPREIKINTMETIYPQTGLMPYGRQSITEEDIQSVVRVLKSRFITQGPTVMEFEETLAKTVDAQYCVAVNSGTSALHIACLAAGIGPGDEVITTPNTFVASANCVVYCGGRPVFADIDPRTYNISTDEIEKKLNKHTKAVIPVHFAGQSCPMQEIAAIVRSAEKKYGNKITIIEDAAHALGSRYKGTRVGSCFYSDMSIMSFHPVKHITTGEGGCILTNDAQLLRKLQFFRSHGITSDPDQFIYHQNAFEKTREGIIAKPWYYEQQYLGYNYRPTDIQCALGLSQLKRLGYFIKRRREIVNIYNDYYKNADGTQIPFESSDCESSFHLYVLLFDFSMLGLNRSQLMWELRKRNIISQVHYIPVHTQPFYQKNFGTKWGDCPRAEAYYQRCLSIPLFPAMRDEDVQKVIRDIKDITVQHKAKVTL